MNPNYLDFEQPIAELEMKIEELQSVGDDAEININEEIQRLKDKSHKLTQSIYSDLSPWDIVRVARHPLRPYSLDYIPLIFNDRQLAFHQAVADTFNPEHKLNPGKMLPQRSFVGCCTPLQEVDRD